MYDPLGDYVHSDGESTTGIANRPLPMPDHVKCFCILCGTILDHFNHQALDGYGYCTECAEERAGECYAVITLLQRREWFGVLVEVSGVLWLSPVDKRLRCSTLRQIAEYIDQVACCNPDAAHRIGITSAS